MASKYDLFKYVYDNTENKDEIVNQFPETIRESMRACMEAGDEGLFNQLMAPTALSEEGSVEAQETMPAPACVESATLPEGDVTDIAQDNLEAVQQMNEEIHEMTPEMAESLPEEVKEGAEIWRDASEDMSKLIIMATHNALKGSDFSEEQILCTGATVAKDLQESGYGKTSLSRAMDNIDAITRSRALEKLCYIKEELESLHQDAEELVDELCEKDNLGLTPSNKEQLVGVVLDNGIYETPDYDVREDVDKVIGTSGDYSVMDDKVKSNILNDFYGYEFSMENYDPMTQQILYVTGNYPDALAACDCAINELLGDCSEDSSNPFESGDCAVTVTDEVLDALGDSMGVKYRYKGKKKKGSNLLTGLGVNKTIGTIGRGIDTFYTQPRRDMIDLEKYRINADTKVKRTQAKSSAAAAKRIYNPMATSQMYVPSQVVAAPMQQVVYPQATAVPTMQAAYPQMVMYKETPIYGPQAAQQIPENTIVETTGPNTKAYKLQGNFSEGNDATEDQVLMQDEALEALVAKYTMLPTLEAKNAMVEDALAHGIPEEYINAMIERSKGEFSEDENQMSEEEYQNLMNTVNSLGSDEIAQAGDVANPVDPIDGTLPAGGVVGEGATQEEMINGAPDAQSTESSEVPDTAEDDGFETIV